MLRIHVLILCVFGFFFSKSNVPVKELFQYDQSNFERNYYSNEAKLIAEIHQIEKGLSHSEFRQGFGLETFANLRKTMERTKNKNSIEYVNALSALKEYFEVHKDFDTSRQKRILGEEIAREIQKTDSNIGGSKAITKKSKEANSRIAFDQLMRNRYSVREYANTPVEGKDVIDAIKMAQKTPTACNRQSPRVAIIRNSYLIKRTLNLQKGMSGYGTPPYLLLVTADNKAYLSPHERHQGYIDGGFFAMSLLLALEFKSLAAVPLHTIFDKKTDIAIRRLLNIPISESLIAFISVGNFREENKVAKSFRYPVEMIVREIKKGGDGMKYRRKYNKRVRITLRK